MDIARFVIARSDAPSAARRDAGSSAIRRIASDGPWSHRIRAISGFGSDSILGIDTMSAFGHVRLGTRVRRRAPCRTKTGIIRFVIARSDAPSAARGDAAISGFGADRIFGTVESCVHQMYRQ